MSLFAVHDRRPILQHPGMSACAESAPTVFVVDDDVSFCRAMARRLGAAGFTVETYHSAEDFHERKNRDGPGCVLLDLRMPGHGGLDAQQMIARTDNPLPIVFLTGHGDVPTSVQAMKQGAIDFLTKPVDGGALTEAVSRALARDAEARVAREEERAWRTRFVNLTPREQEVFGFVVRGFLNKQIAGELGTSERTVKAHRAQVMAKMGVLSVAELARGAERFPV